MAIKPIKSAEIQNLKIDGEKQTMTKDTCVFTYVEEQPSLQGRNIKEDIIVGSYELYITPDYAYIGSLEIDEQYRRKGIATLKLCKLAKQYGKLYLCASSEESERLYSRLGRRVNKENCPHDLLDMYNKWGNLYLIEGDEQ